MSVLIFWLIVKAVDLPPEPIEAQRPVVTYLRGPVWQRERKRRGKP